MKNVLLLFSLFVSGAIFLTLENQQDNVILFPNMQNKLTPFTIRPTSGEDSSALYKLIAECSPSLTGGTDFTPSDSGFCSSKGTEGTVDKLNNLLSSIRLQPNTTSLSDASINYSISPVNAATDGAQTTFSQKVGLTTSIPVAALASRMIFKANDGASGQSPIKTLVAEVGSSYLLNGGSSGLTVTFEQRPDWLDYSVESGKVYLVANPPFDPSNNRTVYYTVNDVARGLSSASLSAQLTRGVLTDANPRSKEQTQLYFLILLGVFTLIIALFVIVLYAVNKRAMGHDRLKESIGGQQKRAGAPDNLNHSYDGKSSVLSDSILQWNKRLVEMHKTKGGNQMLNTSHTKDHESLDKSKVMNYQRFDDSDHAEEHSHDHSNGAGFEDISEIQQDVETDNDQNHLVIREENNQPKHSSFIDEFNL